MTRTGDLANEWAEDDDETTRGPDMISFAEIKAEPIRWLWPDKIPLGKLTLLCGDPGLGKSVITLDVAARVSNGRTWPHAPNDENPAGGVVILSAEDDAGDTMRPRLDAAGADVSRVFHLRGVRAKDAETGETRTDHLDLAHDLPELEAATQKAPDCRLVIIDPITAYMPGGRFDSHCNTDVRKVLAPLAELAARTGVAIVAVTHLRKSDGAAIYRAIGSIAFAAAARAVWAVARDKDDPTGRRRLMLPVKCNIAGDTDGLVYTLELAADAVPFVIWEAESVRMSADDALNGSRSDGGDGALGEAVGWLREYLEDGPRKAVDVKESAEADGIKSRTLDRAKARLGVVAEPDGFRGPWVWRLPDAEPQSAPDSPECAEH